MIRRRGLADKIREKIKSTQIALHLQTTMMHDIQNQLGVLRTEYQMILFRQSQAQEKKRLEKKIRTLEQKLGRYRTSTSNLFQRILQEKNRLDMLSP